jgi:Fe-coproporphyrin III synthase
MLKTIKYNLSSPFLLYPGGIRLIEIQPSLKCNLRCKHCYSESSPDQGGALALDALTDFLSQAWGIGYSYVGVSGGEPLLWDDLYAFLDSARAIGFSTSVSTNGTLLDITKAKMLKGRARIVAVSVDGPPEEHAALRGSPSAFPRMLEGLAALRDAGVPFSLAFTLTRHNADRVSWLYSFADEQRAIGIHVHPLLEYGAADANLSGSAPDSLELKAASWLLALLLVQRGSEGPVVTLDAIQRSVVEQSSWPLLATDKMVRQNAALADLVPSLVVEPDGCIVPFIYGFPRQWSVSFIEEVSLHKALSEWRDSCSADIAELLQLTMNRLSEENEEYVDLFGGLLHTACQSPKFDHTLRKWSL